MEGEFGGWGIKDTYIQTSLMHDSRDYHLTIDMVLLTGLRMPTRLLESKAAI